MSNYEAILEKAKRERLEFIRKSEIESDMVISRNGNGGHTWETCKLADLHNIQSDIAYISDGLILGEVDEELGYRMLLKLASLQMSRPGERCDGNYRWYLEETRVQDLNAAFFITMPLLKLYFLKPELFSERQLKIIFSMFEKSIVWFTDYCENSEMYYPNPAISNSVCLYGIGVALNDQKAIETAREFFRVYLKYNRERGWGWGESISPSYILDLVPPLKFLIFLARKANDGEVLAAAEPLMPELYDFFRFQGDLQPVPCIRNYNVAGQPSSKSGILGIVGLSDDPALFSLNLPDMLLFRDEIENYEENHKKCLDIQKSSVFKKRVFDDKYAVTWASKNVHLGTLTEYPVMPGCMQHPSWGSGWQSMPVAFVVRDEQLAYLRWQVTTEGRRRCFPHETRYRPFDINAALFNERWYPDMFTLAKQEENVAIVLRRINCLHNSASEICDEFAIARFKGEVEKVKAHGVEWAVLSYGDKATLIIGALHGLTFHKAEDIPPIRPEEALMSTMGIFDDVGDLRRDPNRRPQPLHVDKVVAVNDETTEYTVLSQVMYKGEERFLNTSALETSWAIIALEKGIGDAKEYIENEISLKLESFSDRAVYRLKEHLINRITLTADGKTVVFENDPLEKKNWSL